MVLRSSIVIIAYIFSNVASEEAGIAQVANIKQFPGTDGFTSPPKDAVTNTSSF